MKVLLTLLLGAVLVAGATLVVSPDATEAEVAVSPPDSLESGETGDNVDEGEAAVFADVIQHPSLVGEVIFPHLEHVDDFGMECVECHHEVNAEALDIPHESYFEDFWIKCETCHGNGDRAAAEAMSCGKCHPDQPRSVSDQTLSHKVAVHQNCWDCHDIGTGADASAECAMCHSGPRE